MCESCWEEYGKPDIVNEKTEAAAVLVQQVYDAIGGGMGGSLHIVLDDWNLEDDSINWCLTQFDECKVSFEDKTFNVGLTDLEQACAAAFLGMSMEERASTLAKFDGMFGT